MTWFFTILFTLSSYGGAVPVTIGPLTEEHCLKMRRDIVRYLEAASLRPASISECAEGAR